MAQAPGKKRKTLAQLNARRRHKLRIETKKLRDAAEFFATLFANKRVGRRATHRPVTRRGRGRRPVPDILSMPAENMLAGAKWQTVNWRTGTKGELKVRFAAVRVRTADGPPQRIRDKGQQHLPGDDATKLKA